MISFIVIGKNEGWKLIKCFESIFNAVEYNNIKNFEVIYVDSKSTDDSLLIAKRFEKIKVILLTGDCNAAIARNVGVKESIGEVLFFIDGDMEIIKENLNLFYTEISGIYFPFLSGNFKNFYYDKNWNLIEKDDGLYTSSADFFSYTTGGLFLIQRQLWYEVDGMDSRFKKSQDVDFSLRLIKKGYMLLRKKEILAIHHMIPYLDNARKWKDFFFNLYSRSFLYRNNILNKYTWKRMLGNDASAFILFSSLLFILIPGFIIISLIVYILYLLFKVKRKRKNYLNNFFYFILRDILVLIGFFLFFPRKKTEHYKILKG